MYPSPKALLLGMKRAIDEHVESALNQEKQPNKKRKVRLKAPIVSELDRLCEGETTPTEAMWLLDSLTEPHEATLLEFP